MKYYIIKLMSVVTAVVICNLMAASAALADSSSIWGEPGPTSIYIGMWSLHFFPQSVRSDNATNDLLMGVYRGYFVGTLRDSYDHRDYAAGVQRYWLQKPLAHGFNYYLGYRAGLVYGYGTNIVDLGDFTPPVLPFAQLLSSFTWKCFGWELSYTGVLISTEFYIKF